MAAAPDFLKALLKLLEEWELWAEGNSGGKGVVRSFLLPLLRAFE